MYTGGFGKLQHIPGHREGHTRVKAKEIPEKVLIPHLLLTLSL